jgi:epoxyqueuosine reductase QueG
MTLAQPGDRNGQGSPEKDIVLFLEERQVPLFGFADLSPVTDSSRYGFPRSVSFGFPLPRDIVLGIARGPTPEYYAEYGRLNALLAKTARDLESLVLSLGCEALALEGQARQYDATALTTILPHKTSAILAGLGWIGKCNLLITEAYGSAVRLSTVLTDAPLETGLPARESKCGDCRACVGLCPAKAVKGENWRRGTERAELYDAFACQAAAKRLSDAIGAGHTICGICIANCPWTQNYARGMARRKAQSL